MAIRYPITLSTTEPNNDIGLLKIRQADEQTQTLVVQVTETSTPKSYEGLQPFFCAKLGQSLGLGIIEQKLDVAEMTNPKAGQLEYTFRAEDWQQIGRQVGYFSFRKMSDEHEYVEQFTTRDFYFNVTKNVFSDGVTEVKKDGSTYVWTIEDLIRLFNEYISSSKSDWEEFVDQNREVLESVDPGGKLIGELIDARRPFGGEVYPTLGERLDSEKAEVTAQLAQTGYQVPLSATTTEIQDALDSKRKILFLDGDYIVDSPLFIRSNTQITFSPNTVFKAKIGSFTNVNHCLMNMVNISNVKLINKLKIVMNKSEYTSGEQRHCLNIQTVKGLTADIIEVTGSGGDGFYLGTHDDISVSENVYINTIIADNNRRNGVSLICGKNVEINNIISKNTIGALPERGVDFEPNHNTNRFENVIVHNIYTENNKSGSVDFAIGKLKDSLTSTTITVDYIHSKNDGMGVRAAYNNTVGDTTELQGLIHVKKAFIENPKGAGVNFLNYSSKSVKVLFENFVVLNPGNDLSLVDDFDLSGYTSRTFAYETATKIGNIELINCQAFDTRTPKRMFLPFYLSSSAKPIEKLTIKNAKSVGHTNANPPFNLGKGQIDMLMDNPITFPVPVSRDVFNYQGVILRNSAEINIALRLPLASDYPTATFIFKVTNGAINVTPQGTDKINKTGLTNGVAYIIWSKGDYLKLKSDGINSWNVVEEVTNPLTTIANRPSFVGQMACVNGVVYMSTGVSSNADWKQITA